MSGLSIRWHAFSVRRRCTSATTEFVDPNRIALARLKYLRESAILLKVCANVCANVNVHPAIRLVGVKDG